MVKVKKNVVKRRHNLYYEVRLISCNNEKLEKPKKVYLYISPKVSDGRKRWDGDGWMQNQC